MKKTSSQTISPKRVAEVPLMILTLMSSTGFISDSFGKITTLFVSVLPSGLDAFYWSDSGIEIEKKDGSLTLTGICARNISRIKLIKPTELLISPNPAIDFIEISKPFESLKLSEGSTCCVRIYDVFGQEVNTPLTPFSKGELGSSSSQYSLLNSQYSTKIDVSALPPGLYFVRVGGRVGKFLKL